METAGVLAGITTIMAIIFLYLAIHAIYCGKVTVLVSEGELMRYERTAQPFAFWWGVAGYFVLGIALFVPLILIFKL